eukprot:g5768.t1
MTVLEKIFTSFRDSDFTSLEKPGELSFLDLGAAPGGFTEFLLNYERQDCKGRDGKPLPVSVKRGHAITLAVEAGGAKLKLPRLTKGGSYTFQYKDIYDLRAADIECPDVDIVVADADAETAASMNESASQTSSHVYTNYGVRRADSKTTQSVVSSLRQWQLLFKQVALGLAKLKPGGLFIFRFARAIVSDDSASPGASGSTSKPPTVFERDVHFQLCFWFLQSILSLFRGVEPHNRRDDACYIAVHSFKRSQFQSEQWTARLERVCESLAGVKTENELKAQLELAKVSQFATWTLTPLAMERRPHVEKFLNHIKPTELAPMSALPCCTLERHRSRRVVSHSATKRRSCNAREQAAECGRVRSQQASVTLQRRFSDDKRIDTGAGPGNDVPRREAMAAPTSLNASAMLPGPSATTTDRGSAAAAKVSTSLMNESQVSSRVSAGLSALRERSAERLRLLERQRQELDRSLSRVRESSVTRANAADDAASAAPAGDTRQQFAQASGAGSQLAGGTAAPLVACGFLAAFRARRAFQDQASEGERPRIAAEMPTPRADWFGRGDVRQGVAGAAFVFFSRRGLGSPGAPDEMGNKRWALLGLSRAEACEGFATRGPVREDLGDLPRPQPRPSIGASSSFASAKAFQGYPLALAH